MTEHLIDGRFFTFPKHWSIALFDEWPQFKGLTGKYSIKGCDVVALDGDTLWLIEMKDYGYPGADLPSDLWTTMGKKAVGTLALLSSLGRSENQSDARDFARACIDAKQIRIALHIEVKASVKSNQVKAQLRAYKNKLNKVKSDLHLSKAFIYSSHIDTTPWSNRVDPSTRSERT